MIDLISSQYQSSSRLITMNNFFIVKAMFSLLFCTFISENGIKASRPEITLESAASLASEQPNVIIFLADDLGYGDLEYSGHPTSKSPNIDALARNGKSFTNFYVTSPVCSPSRASLLTGRYQMRSGVWPQVFFPAAVNGLPKNETTIANILKNLGYKTEVIGKWHLGVGEEHQFLPGEGSYGFDNYFGIPYSHDMCPCTVCFPNNGSCSIDCSPEYYVACPLFSNKDLVEQPVYLPTLSQRYLNKALQFISESNSDGSPFFLYLAFPQPHAPQFASSLFVGKSPRGQVGDSLLEMDYMVGEIMVLLEALGIGNKTLTWFTSDNGADSGHDEIGGCSGPLRCGKGTTWEGGVRVPSIIHWPGKISPGKSNALGTILDILPTVSTIVGGQYGNLTLDGVDMSLLLFDITDQSPRSFYAVYPEIPSPEEGPYAVIYDQYKAHFYTKGSRNSGDNNPDIMCASMHGVTQHDPPLLFDLYQDPSERWDLGNKSEYRLILQTISVWRQAHMAGMEWMASQTDARENRSMPCCVDSNCEPYPHCCVCPSASNFHDVFHIEY